MTRRHKGELEAETPVPVEERRPGARPTKKTLSAPMVALAAAIFGLLFFSSRFSGAAGGIWDRDLLLWANSFAASNLYIWELADNSLFRGFPELQPCQFRSLNLVLLEQA